MADPKLINIADALESCGFRTTDELRRAGIRSTESLSVVQKIGCRRYLRGPGDRPIYVVMDYDGYARSCMVRNALLGSTASLALVVLLLLASKAK